MTFRTRVNDKILCWPKCHILQFATIIPNGKWYIIYWQGIITIMNQPHNKIQPGEDPIDFAVKAMKRMKKYITEFNR